MENYILEIEIFHTFRAIAREEVMLLQLGLPSFFSGSGVNVRDEDLLVFLDRVQCPECYRTAIEHDACVRGTRVICERESGLET